MKTPDKNWLEWLVFWVSLALVLGVAGYFVYAAATASDRPPQLEAALGEPVPVPGGYAVPVRVSNGGDTTAENVRIEVVLAGSEERGEVVLAFVPQQSTRNGWVTFRTRPAPGQLRAAILGYETP